MLNMILKTKGEAIYEICLSIIPALTLEELTDADNQKMVIDIALNMVEELENSGTITFSDGNAKETIEVEEYE